MAKVVIIGAGFAGHTAALYLGDALGKDHDITVVNRQDYFSYIPSWVWVGIGHMAPDKTIFPLEPVYSKLNINLVHGKATEIHADDEFVIAEKDGSNEVVITHNMGPRYIATAIPIQQPDASWGNMLKEAQEYINVLYRPWLLTPGFLIFVAVLAFNLVGDAIRDILDPKSRVRG